MEEDSNSEYLRIKTPGELNTEESIGEPEEDEFESPNPIHTVETSLGRPNPINLAPTNSILIFKTIGPVDPYDTRAPQAEMSPASYHVYNKTWLDFVKVSKISIDKPPQESDFSEYLINLAAKGASGSTVKSSYSHLNKFFTILYDQSLKQWPKLFMIVTRFCNGSQPKKAIKFTKAEMKRFLVTADSRNRYWLVRKVLLILAYCGKRRLWEYREVTRNSVIPCADGFKVTFTAKNQKGTITEDVNFLIPYGPSELGVDLGSIIQEYFDATNDELDISFTPFHPFLYSGRDASNLMNRETRLVSTPMGVNTLRVVGKDVAKFLKLKNPERYLSLCFNADIEEEMDTDVVVKDSQNYIESTDQEDSISESLKAKTPPEEMNTEDSFVQSEDTNELDEDCPIEQDWDDFSETSSMGKINPYDTKHVGKTIAKKTYEVYRSTWFKFLKTRNISIDKPPQEKDFLEYLISVAEKGFIIKSIYSHLNKFYALLYNQKLEQWPQLKVLVDSCSTARTTKNYKVFTKDQMKTFLETADSGNRYWLVRKVVLILAYCGGKRLAAFRNMTRDSVHQSPEGFWVTFDANQKSKDPLKAKENLADFLIPFGPSELGVDLGSIIEEYVLALKEMGNRPYPTDPFLLCGRDADKMEETKFINSPLGENMLRLVGKQVANFLKLDNPELYVSLCFNPVGKEYSYINEGQDHDEFYTEEDTVDPLVLESEESAQASEPKVHLKTIKTESNPLEDNESDPLEDESNDSMIDPFASTSEPEKPSTASRIINDPYRPGEIVHNIDTRIDPYELGVIEQNMTSRTFNAYKPYWLEFVKYSGISKNVPPEEKHFKEFFVKKHQNGYQGNTIRVLYVHLNKFYKLLYKKKLDQWPRLHGLIQDYNSSNRKFNHFTKEEMKQFLLTADSSNRYWLVRKVVLVLAYCGGNNRSLKTLRYDSVQPCDQGFNVSFTHQLVSNQDSISSGFIIPSGLSELGIDLTEIIEEYLQALIDDDVRITSESQFLFSSGKSYSGIGTTAIGRSRFANSALGENSLREIGKDVANFLGLDSPESYAGRCFKKQYFVEQNQSEPEQQSKSNGVGSLESASNSAANANLKRMATEDDPLVLQRAEKVLKIESDETLE